MEYRNLGKSGLKVSALSFGSWVTFVNQLTEKTALSCMSMAYDQGVNFFDNAEAYAGGKSEILMGKVLKKLKWTRDSYIISSKVFWGGELPTQRGLSKKHIHDACNSALKRLQLDYLDLFFCHRPDPETPIEESVYAMNDLIKQGKILYWGTSEWSAKEIDYAFHISDKYNLRPPVMEQPQYNLLYRDRFEKEYAPIFEKHKIGSTIWSPLASGLLSGKYMKRMPVKHRFKIKGYEWLKEELFKEEFFTKLELIKKIAGELKVTMAQLSIAWCLKNPNVSSVILGASKKSQLKENLASLNVYAELDDEIIAILNSL
ncbi:MAG: aldo/keto reductase [Candidatus Marinimicrobia bacterium]|nr:aldo/keto reductase [Candidatus Neomarinimicrobiota bacterium]